ncbi:MAG: polysaccharide deacetylase family protein [Spirochaetes bacterium]|nr:polysaccharide deacetylase family protein [Spirochaetota bacterium]
MLITISVLLLLVSLSSYYLLDFDNPGIGSIIEKEVQMEIKEKESINRFLSVPILLYHDIDGKGVYSISQDTLRNHFQLLKNNGIRVIKLSELIKRMSSHKPFNDKVIVISFDDGFLSMYTKLLPLLKEYDYPVTLFVYTNNIFTEAKYNLTWSLLREMENNGIEIESHSISHIDLEEISEKDSNFIKKKLFQELYLSKRIIELYMDKEVKYFAFPFGRYNLKLIDMCRHAGYERIFSTDYRKHIITRDNYCLGRGHIKKNYSMKFIEDIIQ